MPARVLVASDDGGPYGEVTEPDVVEGLAQQLEGTARMGTVGDDPQFNVHERHHRATPAV